MGAGLLDFAVGVVQAVGVQLNPLAVDGAFAVVDVAGIEFEFSTGGQSAAVNRLSRLYLGIALAGDGAAVVQALAGDLGGGCAVVVEVGIDRSAVAQLAVDINGDMACAGGDLSGVVDPHALFGTNQGDLAGVHAA